MPHRAWGRTTIRMVANPAADKGQATLLPPAAAAGPARRRRFPARKAANRPRRERQQVLERPGSRHCGPFLLPRVPRACPTGGYGPAGRVHAPPCAGACARPAWNRKRRTCSRASGSPAGVAGMAAVTAGRERMYFNRNFGHVDTSISCARSGIGRPASQAPEECGSTRLRQASPPHLSMRGIGGPFACPQPRSRVR